MRIMGKIFKGLFGLVFYAILTGMAMGGVGISGYIMMLAYAQGKEQIFYGAFVGLIVIVFWAIVFQCLRAWFPKEAKKKGNNMRAYRTYPETYSQTYSKNNYYNQNQNNRPRRPQNNYRGY